MKSVSACLACGTPISHSVAALVSPFLAKRIWGRNAFPVALIDCANCGFAFFNPRLEAEEEARLYAGYRDAEYQRIRHGCEPWYTERFNANLESPEFLANRRAKIREVLHKQLNGRPVHKILDFGGARGEVVLDLLPNAIPYVYDISRVAPLKGITACPNLPDCLRQQVDLVISSNALEHVGYPGEFLAQVKQVCTPNTLFWIEVPQEQPFGIKLALRRIIQTGVLTITRPSIAVSLLRPGLTHLMHEHLNYFTRESLNKLLTRSSWTVLSSGSYDLSGPLGKGQMLWALARPA